MPRHALSAFASAATHAAAFLLVYLTLQVARQFTRTRQWRFKPGC